MKKLVYLPRRPNDLDHIVPVLWHWLRSGAGSVEVAPIGSPTLAEDPRLKFLGRYECFKLWDLQQLLPTELYKRYRTHWRKAGKKPFDVLNLRRTWRKHVKHTEASPQAELFKQMAAPILGQLLDESRENVVILDWAADNDGRTCFDRELHRHRERYALTTIAMPHGDEPHHTPLQMTALDALDPNGACVTYDNCAAFDYVVAPNEACATRFRDRVDESRLKVLGSTRFSEAWMNDGLPEVWSEPTDALPEKGLVVMFLRNPWYPLFWQEIVRTFTLLSHVPGARLVVQHHLTELDHRALTRDFPALVTGKHDTHLVDNGAISSSWLTRRATAVIDLGTSISFDSVRLGKTVVSPEYLHATQTTISHLMPSTRTLDRWTLLQQIERAVAEPGQPNYSDKERRRFLGAMLDVPDSRVLERHTEFLSQCGESNRVAA